MSAAAYSGPASTIASTVPFVGQDLFHIPRGMPLPAVAKTRERQGAGPGWRQAQVSDQRLARDLGDRRGSAARFPFEDQRDIIRQTNCCALHTIIISQRGQLRV